MISWVGRSAALLLLFPLTVSLARADQLPASGSEPYSRIASRHATLGMVSLPVIGLQLGLGLGLKAQQPLPKISFRGLHMASSMTLLGISLFHLNDTLAMPSVRPQSKLHRAFGYSHIGLLFLTGVVGIVRARAYERADSRAKTWGTVHTGLAFATAGTLLGAAFTVRMDGTVD